MKATWTAVLLGVLLASSSVAVWADEHDGDHDHDHDHDHGEEHDHDHDDSHHEGWPDCSCVVGELDCEDTDKVNDALTVLREGDCDDDCSSETCRDAFFVLDMYHAGCPAGELDATVGVAYHEYDHECQRCYQEPAFIEGAPDCDLTVCDDGERVRAAVTALNSMPCLEEAAESAECRDYFRTVLTFHDFCEDVTERVILTNYHDLEEDYESVHCNLVDVEEREIDCDSEINQEFASDD